MCIERCMLLLTFHTASSSRPFFFSTLQFAYWPSGISPSKDSILCEVFCILLRMVLPNAVFVFRLPDNLLFRFPCSFLRGRFSTQYGKSECRILLNVEFKMKLTKSWINHLPLPSFTGCHLDRRHVQLSLIVINDVIYAPNRYTGNCGNYRCLIVCFVIWETGFFFRHNFIKAMCCKLWTKQCDKHNIIYFWNQ